MSLLFGLILAFSCSDVKQNELAYDNEMDKNKSDSFVAASINGDSFYSDAPMFFFSQNIITLAASNKDETEKIRIYINYNNGPTSYPFGKGISNSDNMIYTKDKVDYLAAKTDGKGTITIKDEGNYLEATFSFTGINKKTEKSIQVTQGKFRVLKK